MPDQSSSDDFKNGFHIASMANIKVSGHEEVLFVEIYLLKVVLMLMSSFKLAGWSLVAPLSDTSCRQPVFPFTTRHVFGKILRPQGITRRFKCNAS